MKIVARLGLASAEVHTNRATRGEARNLAILLYVQPQEGELLMKYPMLNRLLVGAALGAAAALSACEEPPREPQPMEEAAPVEAQAAEDAAEPAVAEAPPAQEAKAPVEALPPDQRSSEQTVQPESDTLFY